MNKHEDWWNNLPPHTKEYLKNQPVWYDSDLLKVLAIGIIVGILVGFCWGYSVATPDNSKQPITYLKG